MAWADLSALPKFIIVVVIVVVVAAATGALVWKMKPVATVQPWYRRICEYNAQSVEHALSRTRSALRGLGRFPSSSRLIKIILGPPPDREGPPHLLEPEDLEEYLDEHLDAVETIENTAAKLDRLSEVRADIINKLGNVLSAIKGHCAVEHATIDKAIADGETGDILDKGVSHWRSLSKVFQIAIAPKWNAWHKDEGDKDKEGLPTMPLSAGFEALEDMETRGVLNNKSIAELDFYDDLDTAFNELGDLSEQERTAIRDARNNIAQIRNELDLPPLDHAAAIEFETHLTGLMAIQYNWNRGLKKLSVSALVEPFDYDGAMKNAIQRAILED